MGDDRPPVYYEGDVLIIRASAIGSTCMWELVAAGQGMPLSDVPTALQAAFDEGHRLEPIINQMLDDMGYRITGEQVEGELVITPTLKIRYHPDGYIDHGINEPGPFRILEDKTMANDSWQKAAKGSVGDIFAEYNWQLSVMMWANYDGAPMPALWVGYNKGNSDGSECLDQGRLLFQKVDVPPIDITELRAKALMIQSLVEGDPIMDSPLTCDYTHYPCRFLAFRPENESKVDVGNVPENVEVPEDKREEVDNLVRQYLHNKGIVDEAKQKQDEARDALLALAGPNKKLLTDRWIIPVITSSNSTYDWASVPEPLKKELAKYKKHTSYSFLRGIKPRG